MRSPIPILLFACLATIANAVDFDREIQPLLSDRCFKCHGPDANQRKADLRLDRPTQLPLTRTDAGPLLSPGAPERSELYQRIVTSDGDDLMPPPDSGLVLSESERELFRRWIAEGAKVSEHWSFVPPVKPPVPAGLDTTRGAAIDHFVREQVIAAGLEPAGPADPAKLLRRVHLDLTGLPPTPEDTERFIADPGDAAYERVVDRLLASTRYGEHMAVAWLDAARYADTSGLQYDIPRSNWPYRDWVVDAYNRNLPYDEFITRQLAGDLVPNRSTNTLIATGFNRLNPTTPEGGTIMEEYRIHYVADRITTMGTVMLGLTLECARCHNHKYDPISQREFYQLFAFFNQMEEFGQSPDDANYAPPGIPVPTAEQDATMKRLQDAYRDLNEKLNAYVPELEAQQRRWEQSCRSIWQITRPRHLRARSGAPLSYEADGSIIVGGENPPREIYGLNLIPETSEPITAIRVEALRDPRLPGGGPGRAHNGNAILTDCEVNKTDVAFSKSEIEIETAQASYSQPGFPVTDAIDNEDKSGWALGGPRMEDRSAVFVFKEPTRFTEGEALEVMLRFDSPYAGHGFGRFRVSYTTEPHPLDLDPTGNIVQLARRPLNQRSPEEHAYVTRAFRISSVPRYRAIREQMRRTRAEGDRVMKSIPVAMVMQDNFRRPTHVLERGQYDRPGDAVTPGTPAIFAPLPPGAPPNRLALARWLVSPTHPLTARVAVNRIWQRLFGHGLVRTPNDFGIQGERPTHPRLLDWLAVDFREHGWDIKRLVKQIVMSSTYRQSSGATNAARQRDPRNLLLSHAPVRRLSAEMIRDHMLAVGGVLHEELGGPPVKPWQPAGLWKQLTTRPKFQQVFTPSTGEDLRRRSLYTYWKRAAHNPMMAAFDAPTREACTVRREVTTTPQQALAILHDPQFIEAARGLAQRMLTEAAFGRTSEQRIVQAFRCATGRIPNERETALLLELQAAERDRFTAQPDEVAELLGVGETPLPKGVDRVALAAATMTARAILNLSETITLD